MKMSNYIACSQTISKLEQAFGFKVEVLSSANFEAHGERRIRYTVKRPNGEKHYHAIMLANGSVIS